MGAGLWEIQCMDYNEQIRLDKSALSVTPLHVADEKPYWVAKSPAERLLEVEISRSLVYGYGESSLRLQRVLEFAQLKLG